MEIFFFSDYAMELEMSCIGGVDANFDNITFVHVSYNNIGDCWNPEITYEGHSLFDSQQDVGSCDYASDDSCIIHDTLPYSEYKITFTANLPTGLREEICSCTTPEIGNY